MPKMPPPPLGGGGRLRLCTPSPPPLPAEERVWDGEAEGGGGLGEGCWWGGVEEVMAAEGALSDALLAAAEAAEAAE